MRIHDYRFSDYRLAAYVVIAAVIAGGVALVLDQTFAPAAKIEANGADPAASGAVRQIPIARTSAADMGDPDGKLTPVYPAAPGKDLPVKEAPVVQAKPLATTNGSASASAPGATPKAATSAPRAQFDPRTVRRLPPPGQQLDDDDDDRVVMQAPEQRYDLRRNWISEPQE
jgi:hypothetical protein